MSKIHMRCALKELGDIDSIDIRPMVRADTQRLGALFYSAYVGTVDYEGETPTEAVGAVEATFSGEFGEFIDGASMVLEREGQHLSASFMTLWQDRPLLAFAVTDPAHKGRGLSRRCTSAAMNALARLGYPELDLFVTETNEPAIALYRSLGFVQVGAPP